MRSYSCPRGCGTYDFEAQVAGKVLGTIVSGLFAGVKTRNLSITLLMAGVGAGAGYVVDEIVMQLAQRQCPRCGAVLALMNQA